MLITISIIIVILLLILHYYTGKHTYIITYSVEINGKQELYSCRYQLAVKDPFPTDKEVLNYVERVSVIGDKFRIIDIHKLV